MRLTIQELLKNVGRKLLSTYMLLTSSSKRPKRLAVMMMMILGRRQRICK